MNNNNQTERHIIIGPSGSGKSYFATKYIRKKYRGHEIYHFGDTYTDLKFKKKYSSQQVLMAVPILQEQFLRKQKKKGPVFVFDDLLIPEIVNSNEMLNLFAVGRHSNIHIFFIIQTATRLVPALFYNNMTHLTLFKMNNIRMIKSVFRDYLDDEKYEEFIKNVQQGPRFAKITFQTQNV